MEGIDYFGVKDQECFVKRVAMILHFDNSNAKMDLVCVH